MEILFESFDYTRKIRLLLNDFIHFNNKYESPLKKTIYIFKLLWKSILYILLIVVYFDFYKSAYGSGKSVYI